MPPLHGAGSLVGVGVLVTRPELQALPICRLLEDQGAATLRLPALEIKPLKDRRALTQQLGALENFDIIVFTSANAVRFGVSFLDQKRDLTLAAIGPATARALNQAGYRVAINPSDGFDTEGLLSHPRLEHVAGHRVLIITGSDGRPLLQHELTRRGAAVMSADVYERVPARPTAATLDVVEQRFAAGEMHIVMATSLQAGVALLNLASPALRAEFERVHWLVPGDRVASGLRGLGLQAPILQAQSAQDQALVAELIRWRSSVSGA